MFVSNKNTVYSSTPREHVPLHLCPFLSADSYMKRFTIAAFCLILIPLSIWTQNEKHEFMVWGGFSPDSNVLFGETPDARFGMIALRYSRLFNTSENVNLKYTADIVPAAFLSFPDLSTFPQVRKTAYAFGVAPLGLQANFRPRKKYQPFVGIAGGFLYFNDPIPNAFGKKFNFTLDVGGGLEIELKKKRSVTFGYKYYHISNGFRGDQNPGYDNNLFYVGYTFFRK